MKKAFTMIELIFVIVILGILAAVAVPKLTATRDDAEVAKYITNANQVYKDILAYYTAHGKFQTGTSEYDISKMTNVSLDNPDLSRGAANLKFKNVNCLEFLLNDEGKTLIITPQPNDKCNPVYAVKQGLDFLVTITRNSNGSVTTKEKKTHNFGKKQTSF